MNITNLEFTLSMLEIFGCFVCIMVIIILSMNRHKGKSMRYFRALFSVTGLIFISEAVAYIFRGNTDILSISMTRITNFIVFTMNFVLAELAVQYCGHLIREKGGSPPRIYRYIVDACLAAALLILIINIPTDWMYYFDEENYYHRNFMWYLYSALSFGCVMSGIVLAVKNRKHLSRILFASIITYNIVPFAAIVVQFVFYGISLLNVGIALSEIFMLVAYVYEWKNSDEYDELVVRGERKKLQIIVLFALMVVVMSTSILSCLASIKKISYENSEANSKMVSEMIYDNIENNFMKMLVVSETMSNDYALKTYFEKSGSESPESVEDEFSSYLSHIRDGFDYQMVYAVSEKSKAYYTCGGIIKYVDPENDNTDAWYREFVESGRKYILNVDTDEANNWSLSVFINTEVRDDSGNLTGVCGVGVDMNEFTQFIAELEEEYNAEIRLVNSDGLIQIDSDIEKIEHDSIENNHFLRAGGDDFSIENISGVNRVTKYAENLGWYLVVDDNNPDKINIFMVTIPSIIIFIVGLLAMAFSFGIISIRENKIEKKFLENRLTSHYDELTGLLNRRSFNEECRRIDNSGNTEGYAVAMLDLNGLKTINDTLGHTAGDELIIGAGNCITSGFVGYGNVYRIGGDEFAAILKCSRDQMESAFASFDHITSCWKGRSVSKLSISKGFVMCDEHEGASIEECIKLADALMYEDKKEYYRKNGLVKRVT